VYDLSKVTVRFGERRILDSVSVSLGPEPVAVMGPSGSGKTTLIQVLAGRHRLRSGRVSLDGRPIRFSKQGVADERIAVIHQDYRLVEFLSVLDNVLLAAELRGSRPSEGQARDLLERVGLKQVGLHRKPATLSGGEQQRVAIARAMLCGATVLLADEPTGALDRATTMQITDLLVELARLEQVRVVIATHDVAVARRLGRQMILSDGQLRPVADPAAPRPTDLDDEVLQADGG
jgi:putative ABC transport system ATP-binding protein